MALKPSEVKSLRSYVNTLYFHHSLTWSEHLDVYHWSKTALSGTHRSIPSKWTRRVWGRKLLLTPSWQPPKTLKSRPWEL